MDSLGLLANWPQTRGRYHAFALQEWEPIRKALSLHQRIEVVPDSSNALIGALTTYEQKISVPPGSLLCAIAGTFDDADGCTVQLVDAGANVNMWPAPVQLLNAVGGNGRYPLTVKNGAGTVQQIYQKLHILGRPHPIAAPGFLKLRVKSLASAPSAFQICLFLLTPPEPGEPVNEWNALLEQELTAWSRSARLGAAQGSAAAGGTGGSLVPGQTNPLELPATPVSFDITATGAATYTLVPGAPGYRIALYGLDIQAVNANTLALMNGTKPLRGLITLPDTGGYMRTVSGPSEPHWVLDDGASFIVSVGGAGRFTGDLQYRMLEHWGV